ncbi:MAG: MFS transporter [Burkholderiales bacterium]|nr:MFS transporter [Burkholderiales bacterium]
MATQTLSPQFEEATFKKVSARLIPFLFICYIVAFLDRVNVGFAKLQMSGDLKFSDAVYGFGAGIFFIGYFFFEVPSNVIMEKVGAKIWIARIMITWGLLSTAFMYTDAVHWGSVAVWFGCTDAEFTFYVLRFLLGVAEAGFFPGIILYLTYWFPSARRAKTVALFMTAIAMANVIGSPVSGAIMQYMDGLGGMAGWRWLFLVEGLPSVLIGVLVLVILDDGPQKAKWLSQDERDLVSRVVAADNAAKSQGGGGHNMMDAFRDIRVWGLAFVYFSGVIGFYAVNFWMPTIIQEIGIDKKDFLKVGLLSMIPWGIAAVSMVLVGASSDRTGERKWHVAGSLFVAVIGLGMLAVVGHAPIPSMIALTLVTSGILSFVGTFWALPTAFLTGTAAAAGIAWVNSVGNLGGHFGPDLIGRIRAATNSSEWAFITLAAIAMGGVLLTLYMARGKSVKVSAEARAGKH